MSWLSSNEKALELLVLAISLVVALIPIFSLARDEFERRKAKNFVECEEFLRTSLPSWHWESGSTKLTLAANSTPIQSPSFSQVRLRNIADKNFEDLSIVFEAQSAEIVEIVPISHSESGPKITTSSVSMHEKHKRRLQLSFLNSYSEGGEAADQQFYVVCDGTIDRLNATGQGPGWNVRFRGDPTRKEAEARTSLVTYVGALGWLILVPLFVISQGGAIFLPTLSTLFFVTWLVPPVLGPLAVGWWATKNDFAIPGPLDALKRLLGRK